MYNWVRGGHSPDVRLEQLQEWGYAMTILPGLLVGTVVTAMMRALAKAGAPTPLSPEIRSPADLFNTVGLDDWLAAAERYADLTGRGAGIRRGEPGHQPVGLDSVDRRTPVTGPPGELPRHRQSHRTPRRSPQLDRQRPHVLAHERPMRIGLHRGHLVEVERQHQRGGVAQELPLLHRARGRLVGHEQDALALTEADDISVLAVGRAAGLVGGHAGDRRHRPPLRSGLARPRLGTALGDRAPEGSGEGGVGVLLEQGEGGAVRRAVGSETGSHPAWLAERGADRWVRRRRAPPGSASRTLPRRLPGREFHRRRATEAPPRLSRCWRRWRTCRACPRC